MVLFTDKNDAEACNQRIELVRKELQLRSDYEFHYKKDSDKIKEYFLQSVAPYNFFYYGIVVNKTLLYSDNLQIKESFHKYVSSLVFENAKEKIHDAIVVMDGTYGKDFERSLQSYLKNRFNINGIYKIKKVKSQDSKKNNLLQLADYIASGIHREISSQKSSYMHIIKHREMYVQIRPK